MKNFFFVVLSVFLLGTCLFMPARMECKEFSPFYAKYFLVAGSGEGALKDGPFLHAAFLRPGELVLSEDGKTLYVADSGNHALRAIALDRQDGVSTLCGVGIAGNLDGIGTAASLSSPTQVQASDDGKSLYLLDQDNTAVRHLDLNSRRLETLVTVAHSEPFSSMVLDSRDARLYLSVQRRLLVWDCGAGHLWMLGMDPALACPTGRLVLLGRGLFYYSPCRGHLYRILYAATAFPGVHKVEPATEGRMEVRPVGNLSLTPTASGFCAFEDGPDSWKLLYWDPGQDAFVRVDPATGTVDAYPSTDYQGTVLAGPSADLIGINATSDRRILLKKDVSIAQGAGGVLYVSEPASNRVIGVDSQLLFDNDVDINAIRAYWPKPDGTTRVLVVGDSMVFFRRSYTPEKRFNVNLDFARQLELNLNLESALRGQGRRYEVQCMADQLGPMTGGTATYFLAQAGRMDGRQIDEVLVVIDYMSLCKELFMFAGNRTVDDLATVPMQADWPSMSGAERYKEFGPLTRGLIDEVRTHPERFAGYMDVDGQGNLHFLKKDRDILALPRFQEFGAAVMRKALSRCKAEAGKNGARLSIVLLPSRDLVEIGELGGDDYYDHINPPYMDQPLADVAASLGIRCYNLTTVMRLVALPFYPLIDPRDHHYNFRAQGWAASMLAREMTGSLGASGQAGP